MFTGIIEEIATVLNVQKQQQGAVLTLGCSKVLDDIKIGDSIAINGACQTVVGFSQNSFRVDVAFETLRLTNLNDLKAGDKVNLERAMPLNGRFGGHIVSGHVDETGVFVKKEPQGLADIYYFEAPASIAKYIIHKGSICINGISLTVAAIQGNIFSVSVIPHTAGETTLKDLKSGDKINLESDILAKYIEKFTGKTANSNDISVDYLKEHGFY